MLEKPNLADDVIIANLRDHFGLTVTALEFLPIGYDANAWVYRVEATDSQTYFLKVKKGAIYIPSVEVPRYLKDSDIQQIVAPLPTQSGSLCQPIDHFGLILYPFIEGKNGAEHGMSLEHWFELGTILRRVHALPLTSSLQTSLRVESFAPTKWMDKITMIDGLVQVGQYTTRFQEELAAFWTSKRDDIHRIVERTTTIGRKLQANPPPFVLCHADIHIYNVLITPQNQFYVVDWDEAVFAPKERDLMFVSAGVGPSAISEQQSAKCFEGYGAASADPLGIAYYRYEWAVQEIAEYAAPIFLSHDLGEITLTDAVRGFRQLFAPGDVVDVAYQSEALLA